MHVWTLAILFINEMFPSKFWDFTGSILSKRPLILSFFLNEYDVSFKGIRAFIDISQTKSYFFESSSLPVVKPSVS